jgi:hypothetical protein
MQCIKGTAGLQIGQTAGNIMLDLNQLTCPASVLSRLETGFGCIPRYLGFVCPAAH